MIRRALVCTICCTSSSVNGGAQAIKALLANLHLEQASPKHLGCIIACLWVQMIEFLNRQER
jgi:hypothetical protein